MSKSIGPLAALLALTVVLAGCVGGKPVTTPTETTTSPPVVGTCTVKVDELFAHTYTTNFTLKVIPTCGFLWNSTHVAAHFANESTATPSLTHYKNACTIDTDAKAGDEVAVACSAPGMGMFFLRGHAIIKNGGVDQHYWSDEFLVIVKDRVNDTASPGAVSLKVLNVPSRPVAGQDMLFKGRVGTNGTATGIMSNHTGAHWGLNSSATFNTTVYPNSCVHVNATLPGDYPVTCRFPNATNVYVRGHARFELAGVETNFWADEMMLTVRSS